MGAPVTAPTVLLLLPIVYTAIFSTWRNTLVTGLLVVAYVTRHSYLNRMEYVSPSRGFSGDDFTRIAIFVVTGATMVAIARYREKQRDAQRTVESAYLSALESNRTRSEFLAMVSHELRTPLSTILQYTDLLREGIGGPVTAEQAEMLSRVEAGSLHLRTLIQQLLEYAQVGAGKATVRLERVDLSQLVQVAVALLEPSATERGLDIRVEAPDTGYIVEIDPAKIRQIVLNLTENAIKFTDRGEVVVRLVPEPGAWRLEVEDTGIGMTREVQERIYEPFWQGEDPLTRRHSGLGLGLAVTRDLVSLLGGSIEVESVPRRGTRFTVRIPLLETSLPPASRDEGNSVPEAR